LDKKSNDPIEAKCHADFKEAWDYCHRNSKSVELLYKNEDNQTTLAKVHFRFDPKVSITSQLSNSLRFCFFSRMSYQKRSLKG